MNQKTRVESSQRIYNIFGLHIFSDHPFLGLPVCRIDEAISNTSVLRLYFTCNQTSAPALRLDGARLISAFQYEPLQANRWDRLYLSEGVAVWQFAWGAEYHIQDNKIDCYLHNPAHLALVETFLTGPVLALWLEMQVVPALHASAVVGRAGGVMAFLAYSGSGKSSLVSACLQSGAALLTDDILPLEEQAGRFMGRPGLPQVNMWPDQAAVFIPESEASREPISTASKKKYPVNAIRGGAFCNEQQPLACIYLPERITLSSESASVEITPVPPVEAVIELMRYSFIPPFICEEMGWQARRMDFFARLVEKVPVRRLRYPSGFEHLPAVTAAVLRDSHTRL